MPDTPRDALATAFLATTDWASADRAPLAGDASNRKYQRLHLGDDSAVLMDAAPELGEDVRPFVAVADWLTGLGLSAPRIIAQDPTHGFLLIEDLGDDLFARVVARDPALERPLYEAATDVLLDLHRAPAMAGLKPYDPAVMTPLAALAYDWYLAGARGRDDAARDAFCAALEPVLAQHTDCSVVILRDYHAENLLWLPDRTGAARVGLLDFQDAMTGDPSYDLVSILMDARRDVSAEVETAMITRYADGAGMDRAGFEARYHVAGAQRNLRIIGAFARLSQRDGKRHYVDLIPRVWGLLMRNLSHPALADVAAIVRRDLPEPTPDVLKALRR
ncbi:aminoglycoside phosphotransferase family protein [Pseudooceanicola onchidii]|uniref:aminoglycoside phosphotransferase family protein n=1 Tax=Pseudooceanicola onchidii TaxID=2562279 RepID=UPI0010A9BA43|nr:phosphotransferase [Pseudooceanicola onchidii]